MQQILILDLDNTIFETNSIGSKVFEPILKMIETHYHSINKHRKAKQIIHEMWSTPIDTVLKKHNAPEFIKEKIYASLNTIEYKFGIDTYSDYKKVKQIQHQKVLVTTGFSKLQEAKIDSLKIRQDFNDIFIDDPLSKSRKYKSGIFEEIVENSNLTAQQIWVIGDSVENEIKAGKDLGMNTIQRLKKGQSKSIYSDYGIESFHELDKIIN